MSGYCHVLSRLLKGLSSCFPHFYPCLPRVCNSQHTNCISLWLQLKQMITTLGAWNENYLSYSCHGSDIQAQYGSVGSIYATARYWQGCDLEALGKICFWSFRLLTEFSSIRGRPDVLIFLLAFGEVWFSAARSFLHSLVQTRFPHLQSQRRWVAPCSCLESPLPSSSVASFWLTAGGEISLFEGLKWLDWTSADNPWWAYYVKACDLSYICRISP